MNCKPLRARNCLHFFFIVLTAYMIIIRAHLRQNKPTLNIWVCPFCPFLPKVIHMKDPFFSFKQEFKKSRQPGSCSLGPKEASFLGRLKPHSCQGLGLQLQRVREQKKSYLNAFYCSLRKHIVIFLLLLFLVWFCFYNQNKLLFKKMFRVVWYSFYRIISQ